MYYITTYCLVGMICYVTPNKTIIIYYSKNILFEIMYHTDDKLTGEKNLTVHFF